MIASAPSASSAVSRRAPRKQVVRLLTLWGQFWSAAGPSTAAESREARLHYIAAIIGRSVSSANDLAPSELAQVNRTLTSELKRIPRVPNPESRLSTSMLWKIRQLESFLRWSPVPARLSGFLQDKFGVRAPDRLTRAQASRAIEALFRVAARNTVKTRLGQDHEVGKRELAAEVRVIKDALRSWSPPDPSRDRERAEPVTEDAHSAPRVRFFCASDPRGDF